MDVRWIQVSHFTPSFLPPSSSIVFCICYAPALWWEASVNAAIHPSVCPMPIAQPRCILRLWSVQNTNRKPCAGDRAHQSAWPDHTVTRSGRDGNKATWDALARWLHHDEPPLNCHRQKDISFHRVISYSFCTSSGHSMYRSVSWGEVIADVAVNRAAIIKPRWVCKRGRWRWRPSSRAWSVTWSCCVSPASRTSCKKASEARWNCCTTPASGSRLSLCLSPNFYCLQPA